MTSNISSIFKKSLLASSIVGLVACGGGNSLDSNGLVDNGGGGGGGGGGSCTENCEPPPPPLISVRDFGGINGKIVLDANHDYFAVGTDGTLYAYNAAAGAPDPDSDGIPADRLAKVRGVSVASDNAIEHANEMIGAVAADQTSGGELFYVLTYGAGTEQGYLDIDINKNYRGFAADDKTDALITQIRSVAIQNSFQGLLGNVLWQPEDGDLVAGSNIEALAAEDNELNFSFMAPTSENYHFVLREFDHPYTDLDIRLIDPLTGRILASSYGILSGEVISFPLVANATYGVNVLRNAGSEDASFLLSIKPSPDTGSADGIQLPNLAAGSSMTIRGTVHPVTRLEFCSRFPATGWLDASSDASSDATADSLFLALLGLDASDDASNDASSDATADAPAPDQKDVDKFWFNSTNTAFLTDYTFKIFAEGGGFMSRAIQTYNATGRRYTSTFYGLDGKQRTYPRTLTRGEVTYDLEFSERESVLNGYDEETVEYEMIIERE